MSPNEYTLKSLLSSPVLLEGREVSVDMIEIPRIQRDYAQGRNTPAVCKIRNKFLDALHSAVTGTSGIALDFVYGDISEGKFIPLDGQQRLTTLLLLHWYASRKEAAGIPEGEADFLAKFTYETRTSSKDFFQQMCVFYPEDMAKPLGETVRDQYWFQMRWSSDPTVESMLTMLDAIQAKFHDVDNLWGKLTVENRITFYFKALDLQETDEIYIKMNSRGKPLTPFEHFKAEFGSIIEKTSPEKKGELDHKIDVEWTRMLFRYRGEDNTIDDEFMRYFHFICSLLCFEQDLEEEADDFKVAYLLFDKEKNEKASENLSFFEDMFDCWCKNDPSLFLESVFSGKKYIEGKVQIYQDDVNLFKECCDKYKLVEKGKQRPFPLRSMLMLYAATTFLNNKKNGYTPEDLKTFISRLRIVRNLAWNSSDEIRATDGVMRFMMNETKSIILTGVISPADTECQKYNVSQVKEELKKQQWLVNHSEQYSTLCKLEDHKLLQGSIEVVGMDNLSLTDTFYSLFKMCTYDKIGRALLTFGDYSQTLDWKIQFGNDNDSTWQGLFHLSRNRKGFERTSECLLELLKVLNRMDFSADDVIAIGDRYYKSDKTPKDWRYYFVKYDSMRKGKSGRYWWTEDPDKVKANQYCVFMMNTAEKLSGYHWEIFSKTLYDSDQEHLTLGNYASQDFLRIKGKDISFEFGQSTVTVRGVDPEDKVFTIPQSEDGIDTVDRVEWVSENVIKPYL